MRVLVCGSRHFNDYDLMEEVLNECNITELIEGEARGADLLARRYAEGRNIPVQAFPAQWGKYRNAAGPIRNKQMLVEGKPELVVAFRASDSKGTQNMIDQAAKAGVTTIVIDFDKEDWRGWYFDVQCECRRCMLFKIGLESPTEPVGEFK